MDGLATILIFLQAMNRHVTIDCRLLALHELVREKFLLDPAGVRSLAVRNLARWRCRGADCEGYAQWVRILESASDRELADILVERSERADALRQSTPFTGVITQAERAAVFLEYSKT